MDPIERRFKAKLAIGELQLSLNRLIDELTDSIADGEQLDSILRNLAAAGDAFSRIIAELLPSPVTGQWWKCCSPGTQHG